jgi:hypothetical protein
MLDYMDKYIFETLSVEYFLSLGSRPNAVANRGTGAVLFAFNYSVLDECISGKTSSGQGLKLGRYSLKSNSNV